MGMFATQTDKDGLMFLQSRALKSEKKAELR